MTNFIIRNNQKPCTRPKIICIGRMVVRVEQLPVGTPVEGILGTLAIEYWECESCGWVDELVT